MLILGIIASVIGADFKPRLARCEACVFAVAPLEGTACVVASARGGALKGFFFVFAFFNKLFIEIYRLNIISSSAELKSTLPIEIS